MDAPAKRPPTRYAQAKPLVRPDYSTELVPRTAPARCSDHRQPLGADSRRSGLVDAKGRSGASSHRLLSS